MNVSRQNDSGIWIKSVQPGLGLVWVTKPGGGIPFTSERTFPQLASQRSEVLAQGANWHESMIPPQFREVTLMDGWRLDPEMLLVCLQRLYEGRPELLIRLAWPVGLEAPTGLPQDNPLVLHWHWYFGQNSKAEMDDFAGQAGHLAKAGIAMAGEVLLPEVLPDGEELAELLRGMMRNGVRPYYLVLVNWKTEGNQERMSAALELAKGLRGWISGSAVPQLVWENADGQRTLFMPEFVETIDLTQTQGKTFRGDQFTYPHPEKPDESKP